MDWVEEELLKLCLTKEDVTDPELFLKKLHAIETFDDREEVRKMIHRRSTKE